MTYSFSRAADPLAIAEQQYATASTIKFTKFTSCIGVIVKKNSLLTGVHLVMVAKDGTKFNENAATRLVSEILNNEYDKVLIIGGIDMWTNPENNVHDGYQMLISLIRSPEKVQTYQFGDGAYTVTTDGDDIEIT